MVKDLKMDQTQETETKKFDIMVTHRDEKTGAIIRTNPYSMHAISHNGAVVKLWERPVGSGNVYYGNGKPAGRWEKDSKGRGSFKEGVAHIDFKPPETEDQKLQRKLTSQEAELLQLRKELESIKTEAKKKSADKKES